jgi:hypothetical protein
VTEPTIERAKARFGGSSDHVVTEPTVEGAAGRIHRSVRSHGD